MDLQFMEEGKIKEEEACGEYIFATTRSWLELKDGKYRNNEEPYPIPLVCIDTEEIHFKDTGHMNFKDLPFFSRRPPRFWGRDGGNYLFKDINV